MFEKKGKPEKERIVSSVFHSHPLLLPPCPIPHSLMTILPPPLPSPTVALPGLEGLAASGGGVGIVATLTKWPPTLMCSLSVVQQKNFPLSWSPVILDGLGINNKLNKNSFVCKLGLPWQLIRSGVEGWAFLESPSSELSKWFTTLGNNMLLNYYKMPRVSIC